MISDMAIWSQAPALTRDTHCSYDSYPLDMRRPLFTIVFCALLSSCGAIKQGTASSVSKMGNGFERIADLTTSPFRPGLPVVEAREGDMRELESGHDRALAYQAEQRRKRGWWIFGGPVDFEEPALPEIGDSAEASLLPELSD